MRLPLLLVSGALAYLNGVLALQPLTPMRHRTLRLASNQWPRSPRSSMTMVAALPAPSDVLVNARSTLFNAVRLSSAALQNTNPRTLAVFAAGVVCGLVLTPAFRSLVPFETVEDIPGSAFRAHRVLNCRVEKVSDGDTYRVTHLGPPIVPPPIAAFVRRLTANARAKPGKKSAPLSERTLQVRIAAVDTPETAKFGKEAQPLGDVATDFAKEQLLGRTVQVRLLSRDQYGRAVASVMYRRQPSVLQLLLFGPLLLLPLRVQSKLPFVRPIDMSEELLKRGLAVVYRQGGGQYDGPIERWDKLEARAKERKLGVWAKKGGFETPAEYKKRTKG